MRAPKAGNGSGTSSPGRRPRNSGPIGKRAEEVARRYIIENATALGARDVRWMSDEGFTPGWDIEYTNNAGELVRVEVKGTAASAFANVELTAGEWCAAKKHGDHYWLFLVAECCGAHARIQRIQNPARLVQAGEAELAPVVYRFAAVSVPPMR